MTLHPLLSGEVLASPAWLHRVEGRLGSLKALGIGIPRGEWVALPIVSFLVEHPGAGPVLVDTGLHPSVAVDPRQNLGRLGGLLFKGIRMDARQSVPAQLRERGIDPAAVKVVVMTDLHIDHASAMSEFPEATFLFSKEEWAAATAPRAQLQGYMRRQFDHAFDYRTLDFEGPDADSFVTFARSLDLFGDGSVRAVYTPGHTPGHMSVVLRLRDREALLIGDAAYTMRTLKTSERPWRAADEHRFLRSLREIQFYVEQTPDALVVPGHDMEAWRALEPAY